MDGYKKVACFVLSVGIAISSVSTLMADDYNDGAGLAFPERGTVHGAKEPVLLDELLSPQSLPEAIRAEPISTDSVDFLQESDDEYGYGGHHGLKHGRADAHSPAGLSGAHVHRCGEWMFEYKYAHMFMDGNRFGRQRVTDVQALDITGTAFAATPTRMTMDMHMLHIMYGWNDDVTLYIMPMLMSLSMDHLRRNPLMGDPDFTARNSGFGDLIFGGLWRVWDREVDEVIFNFGMRVPTGDIDALTDAASNGMMAPTVFPYPMRLGTGTFNFRPGVTYRRYWECASIGVQFLADVPVGKSSRGYAVGNDFRLNFWYSRLLDPCKRWAFSYRVEAAWMGNYSGFDTALGANNTVISTARTDMRGGDSINFAYGLTWMFAPKTRLKCELMHPVYRDLDGVQLETDLQLWTSLSRAF
jgi:hypothetical protein